MIFCLEKFTPASEEEIYKIISASTPKLCDSVESRDL